MTVDRDRAEECALRMLGFLSAREEAFLDFLAQSGITLGELRARAGEPEVLAAVMDFILGDESLARDFCTDAGMGAEAVMRLRMALPGGAAPHWT